MMMNFIGGFLLLASPFVAIILYVLGIYALILFIKALKIYIKKNSN